MLSLRDNYGNKPILDTNTNYTFNVYSILDNSSLEYSNVTSTDSNIVPTINSTWEQIGDTIYGTDNNDTLGSNISLSSDGLVVAFRKGSDVEVYEKINENWTQRGDTINLDDNFSNFNLSVDGTKLIIRTRENNTDNFKIIMYKYDNTTLGKN